jgi:hypothetical protein
MLVMILLLLLLLLFAGGYHDDHEEEEFFGYGHGHKPGDHHKFYLLFSDSFYHSEFSIPK